MSLSLRPGLSKADLLAALRRAAATERGVVAADPDEVDPEAYVRPGFEHLADDDDDDDAFSRFLGIRRGTRYEWVELHFDGDDDGGWTCSADFRGLSARQTDVVLHFQSLVSDGDWS